MKRAIGVDTSCYTTSLACYGENGIECDLRTMLPVEHGARGLRQSEGFFLHMKRLETMVPELLGRAGRGVSCVCVSVKPRDEEPSYMPVFRAGVAAAAILASALDVPLLQTTHQRGHLSAALIGNESLEDNRFLALHLSGGTTDLLDCGETVVKLGGSLDLCAGQLVDRIGVALGLGFPAGKELEALAVKSGGGLSAPSFVRGLGCSFSGAETKLLGFIADGAPKEDAAFAVYGNVVNTVDKLLHNACGQTDVQDVLVMGGVATSALLRRMLKERADKRRRGYALHFGKPELSGDNAVGVARMGYVNG